MASYRRGISTIRTVGAGDFLFCEKAFGYAFHDDHTHNTTRIAQSRDEEDHCSFLVGNALHSLKGSVNSMSNDEMHQSRVTTVTAVEYGV
ncbi:hypothetical protein N7470_009900 [Penicillium chermesinum]|nr:hypothetical protein N7470_009900 [Penicillium chermesinum]